MAVRNDLLLILSAIGFWFQSSSLAAAQSWKKYPLVLEDNSALTFPSIEGAQYQYMSDSWFFTAQVQGQHTGKKYQIVTIFDRNYITAVILNFYQVSIFDYETGEFNTYTSYDLPVVSLLDQKFHSSGDHQDVSFDAPAGKSFWNASRTASGVLDPFVYDLHCAGQDILTSEPFSFSTHVDMQKKPVAFGASDLRGVFTFYAQPDTLTYWQPGPLVSGSLTFQGVTEPISGTKGHIDRQSFPLYSGIFTPTGRQHSHEWRQINLGNGIDISIWRQFDRVANNSIIDTSGVTVSYPPSASDGDAPQPSWTNGLPSDLIVEYISFEKFPRGNFSTLIPPPSKNMYMPSAHIIRSKSLNMTLKGTYTTAAPVAQLPIEYFEGPAIWEGTFLGQQVTGVGIFESTLGLYRGWELAAVLRDSVAHLPTDFFSVQSPRQSVVKIVEGLQALVSVNLLKDNRLAAASYLDKNVVPALESMTDAGSRARMLEIAYDFKSSLYLILQF